MCLIGLSYRLSGSHITGTNHIGIAYTFVVYKISRHIKIQQELRKEFLTFASPLIYPDGFGAFKLPSTRELESLPLLNAVIRESLRLRGTLPTPNPRVTPTNQKTTIGQYNDIPGGVRVNCFAWCLHRNEAVYPDPEEWRPERWLGNRAERKEQEKWLWTFGSGRRMCLGNHLSMEST